MVFEKMHNLDPECFSNIEFIDVAILMRKEIINGRTGSDDDVAALFNI